MQLHNENHFTSNAVVRDIIIGMSDGLTVPFALAAGLSVAVPSTALIVVAGLAEISAGAISMGLGGYLATKNDYEHYYHEQKREQEEIIKMPEKEKSEVVEILKDYGINQEETVPIIKSFEKNPTGWVNFMMRNELNLEKPDKNRIIKSPLAIALSYIVGGMIPLIPYMLTTDPLRALLFSALLTSLALLIFGYIKAKLIGAKPLKSAILMLIIGGLAASVAYFVAKLF